MYNSYSFLYEAEDLKVAFIIKVSSFTNLDFFYILLRCSLPCKIHMHVCMYLYIFVLSICFILIIMVVIITSVSLTVLFLFLA